MPKQEEILENSLNILLVTVISYLLLMNGRIAFSAETNEKALPSQSQATALSQILSIRYAISEPCSLVSFVNILTQPGNKTWLKDWFESQCRADVTLSDTQLHEQALLARYKELLDRSDNQDVFDDKSGRRLSLSDKTLSLASEYSELPDFLAKLKGVVKSSDYAILEETFNHFEKPYRKILWDPRLALLKEQLSEFERQSHDLKMMERLTFVQAFMQSKWLSGLTFVIILVPLPEPPSNNKSTSGKPLGAVQTVELLPKTKFKDKGDVIFHELCHSLWFAKPGHEAFEREFQIPDVGILPMTELYEGMATAIAQGWFAQKSFGKSPANWYGDKIINRYAHLVEPLYASYLNAGKAIDADFARQATKIYLDHFSDAIRDIKSTSGFLVISEQEMPDLSQFRNDLARALPRSRELSCLSKIDAPSTIEDYRTTSAIQMAVLLARSDLSKLANLGVSPSQIIELKTNNTDTVNLKVNNKRVLICMADTTEQQQHLLFGILQKGKWPSPLD